MPDSGKPGVQHGRKLYRGDRVREPERSQLRVRELRLLAEWHLQIGIDVVRVCPRRGLWEHDLRPLLRISADDQIDGAADVDGRSELDAAGADHRQPG